MTPHYDDELLFQYAEGTCPIREEVEAHVSGCAVCAAELDAQREIVETLKAAAVWDDKADAPAGAPPSTFTSMAQRLASEDARARVVLDDVLSKPSTWWRNTIWNSEGGRTAGMVRQLLDRYGSLLNSSPAKAIDVTTLAMEISDDLSIVEYPSDFVIGLRAQSLRSYAYVLWIMGKNREALAATDRAEGLFLQTPLPNYEMARLGLVRAHIYSSMERTAEAIELTRASAETFAEYGDRSRYLDAKTTEAIMQFRNGAHAEALAVWQSVEHDPSLSDLTRVRVVHNIGVAHREMGHVNEAVDYLTRAAAEFEMLGITTERTRARWAMGQLLASANRIPDSLPVLRQAWREFEELGMEADAALAALELAEGLLTLGQPAEVPAICRTLLDRFTRAGMTSRAITALAFLREAIAIGQATPAHVRHVHDFLRGLPAQAARLFAPPPAGSLES